MAKHNPYGLTTPCADCPFRTDITPYLPAERVEEIGDSLVRSEFPCHKTTKFDEEGEVCNDSETMHCAGALILLEHMNQPSQMMRIAERLGMYDRSKLDMNAPVYDDIQDMIEAAEDQGP